MRDWSMRIYIYIYFSTLLVVKFMERAFPRSTGRRSSSRGFHRGHRATTSLFPWWGRVNGTRWWTVEASRHHSAPDASSQLLLFDFFGLLSHTYLVSYFFGRLCLLYLVSSVCYISCTYLVWSVIFFVLS